MYVWGLWIQLSITITLYIVSLLVVDIHHAYLPSPFLRTSRSHKEEGGIRLGHRRLGVPSESRASLWGSAERGPTWHHRLQRRDRHLGWGPPWRPLHITTGAVPTLSDTRRKLSPVVSIDQPVVTKWNINCELEHFRIWSCCRVATFTQWPLY